MGEAKEREKAGEPEQKKMFAESDACPLCGKSMSSMEKEHAGKLLTFSGGAFIICWRCGNIFFPKSRIKHLEESIGKTIIDPSSPIGQATQQAASKLVLPGVK